MEDTYTITPKIEVLLKTEDLSEIATAIIDNLYPWATLESNPSWYADITAGRTQQAVKALMDGCSLNIFAEGESEPIRLTKDGLVFGIRRHLEEGDYVHVDSQRLVLKDLSCEDCDCILQWALFDEQRF